MLLFWIALAASSIAIAQPFWERLPAPNATGWVQCIDEDVVGGKLYVGMSTGGGIYVSTDNGATWSLKANGLTPNQIIFDIEVDNSGVAYAVGTKIFKSTNGGDLWEELANSVSGMTNLHITSGGTIFAGHETAVGNGISRSTDGGTTWEFARTGLPTIIVGPATYYRSVSSITSDGSGNLYATVNGGNASTEAGVYKSTDNGGSWTRMSSGLLANINVKSVIYSPNGMLYVGVRNRVYKSIDGGTTWVQGDSIPIASSSLIRHLVVNSSNQVFASTSVGTFRAAKGGIGWTSISNPVSYANDFLVTGSNAYLSCSNDIWGTNGGIHQSTDEGATWNGINMGLNNTLTFALKVGSSGAIFNGLGGGRVEYSYDNGATFTRAYLSYSGPFALAGLAAFEENGAGTIVGATGEGLHTSTDHGVTWVKTSTQTGNRALTLDLSGNFIAANDGGVFKSTDNGQTWNSLGGGGGYSVFLTTTGTILSGTYNSGINRRTNGGTTWTNSGTTLFGNITIGTFVQLPNGNIFVHTLFGMYKSTDDGESWSAQGGTPIGEQYRKLASAGGTLLLGTPGGLYKSTDGGGSWTNHKDGLLYTILDHLSVGPDGRVYGAGGAGIYRTKDPITTGVEQLSEVLPTKYELMQNYPNPFNPKTDFRFRLPAGDPQSGTQAGIAPQGGGFVSLKVFDVLGREVATLVNEELHPGEYKLSWDASGQPSGVYYYRLQAGRYSEVRKMILAR